MCSTWEINGRFCHDGAGLIEAIGVDAAKRANTLYGLELPDGSTITDEAVARGCLCHVDVEALRDITGVAYRYDLDADAFIPSPSTQES